MAEGDGDLGAAVAKAAGRVRNVRSVAIVRLGHEVGTNRVLVALRVGLPPLLALSEVVSVIAHVQLAVARLVPRGAAVFVEPDVAADQATPTETIVIRALE
jgi:hypothetical protein